MSQVLRFVTRIDLDDDVTDASLVSLSARLDAVLLDGRRVLLLDDRGWTFGLRDPLPDRAEIRAPASVRRIEAPARVVVGPDEPVEGDSEEDAEAAYWTWMADLLGRPGVEADPSVLKQLPHDVTFSDEVRARVDPEPDAA